MTRGAALLRGRSNFLGLASPPASGQEMFEHFVEDASGTVDHMQRLRGYRRRRAEPHDTKGCHTGQLHERSHKASQGSADPLIQLC